MIAWWRCTITITNTNADISTNTDFHIEHINTNTWVRLVPFFLCVSPWLKSWVLCSLVIPFTCAHEVSDSPSTLLSPYLPLAALLPLLPALEARRQPAAHSAQREYDFKETSVEPYTELLNSPPFFSDKGFPTLHSRVCFAKLTEYTAITLNEKTWLSVCRRQCPTERGDLLETERSDLLSKVARKHRLGLCSTNKKSKFLPSARRKSIDTNLKPLTIEEVY